MSNGKSASPVNTGNVAETIRFDNNVKAMQVGGADLFEQGQIAYQFAPGVLNFVCVSGYWYQQRSLVRFLDYGYDQNFGSESGYLTTESPDRGMTSMQINGYPGRKMPFVVLSLGLRFDLPYTPASTLPAAVDVTRLVTSLKASKSGPQRADCLNVAEQLFRNGLVQSYIEYEIDQNCKRQLGLPEFFPAATGVSNSLIFRSNFGPSANGQRLLLPREAIVLPKSTSDNQLEHLVRLVLTPQSASAGRGTPVDPSFATPADYTAVSLPVILTMEGFFARYVDDPAAGIKAEDQILVEPADEYEAARLAAYLAKNGG